MLGAVMRPPVSLLTSEEPLYTSALRALMRRAYSVHEMRVYLERRSGDPELAQKVVGRLKTEKLINDERYALDFARQRAQTRKQGRYRIARELRTRGVPDRQIDAALAQTFAETDESALVQKLIERRLKTLRGPLEARQVASLQRLLLRAGFDSEMIRSQMHAALAGRAATIPDIPDEESAGEV
jgi:regulatory protein